MITAILGGGQLARMLALAGAPLGMRSRCLDPNPDSVAGHVTELIVGNYDDPQLLQQLADGAEVCTFEFENVPVSATDWLTEHSTVRPHPRSLAIGQDRLNEKLMFQRLGIGVAQTIPAATREELVDAVEQINGACIVKTRRLGYDGRGQVRIKNAGDTTAIEAAFDELTEGYDGGLVVEAMVPFDRELSVIAVRGKDGEVRTWPLVQNEHEGGILRRSRAPAIDLTAELQQRADELAALVLNELDYVGVIAIELFEVSGQLLANELAPRVHNSGHWTIEGSVTSQFENHLRAVHGLPLGSTEMVQGGVATMINLIGEMPSAEHVLSLEGVHLHDYGKSARANRKLGHATVLGSDRAETDAIAAKILG